jgi:hypothetical protein
VLPPRRGPAFSAQCFEPPGVGDGQRARPETVEVAPTTFRWVSFA